MFKFPPIKNNVKITLAMQNPKTSFRNIPQKKMPFGAKLFKDHLH